ncbi:FUSC family protein [Acidipila sp. EB88]|uniref:FUSC family protein n=1 Tax=Acidipila sp. EB88 TaxID=2305226 RepID=UPI000F6026E0|nr:FUSC family protein [Acidipila sp. EB88]
MGIAIGHPAGGMIAAGGAMTAGFGAKQSIDNSPLLPIIFVSFGMAFCTFIGVVAGHNSWVLTVLATLFGFGYGMMSRRAAGYSWVGQQCVVTLLVASAFPSSPEQAAQRSALIFAGGIIQLLFSAFLFKAFGELGGHVRALASYVRSEELALRRTYLTAVLSLRHRQMRNSALPYACRLAAVLAISTEIYHQLHFESGYWIPMTALLVLRPGIADTASRAIARTVGTLAGGVLSSVFLVYVHPSPYGLAVLVVLFTWLSYGVNNVNYGLFSLFLTSYIVFLLSLNHIPGAEIAHRRFVCTMVGGAIALSVRLFVIRLRNKQDQESIQVLLQKGSVATTEPAR